MAYCTLADIEKKRIPTDTLVQLTDESGLDIVDETTVDECIKDATVLVEGYLRGRYSLPLNPVPDLAASIVADLAAYNIYCLKPEFEVPKTIAERRTTALALLARIQDGKMPLNDPVTAPTGTPAGVSCTSAERIFSRNTMRNL